MNTRKIFLFSIVVIISSTSAFAGMSTQFGANYGKEFRHNDDVMQYEIFWRQPLSFKTTLGKSWNVSTDVEAAMALISESGADDFTPRFSLMPQVVLSPYDMVNFIIGLGAGYMAGSTTFGDEELGGRFFFAAKLGVQFVLGDHWGVECDYYHQSNASIYSENNGLNMYQLALAYNF